MRKLTQKKLISTSQRKTIERCISGIREIPDATFADAEVSLDTLAGNLRDAFYGGTSKIFKNRAPALHEVIERLSIDYKLDEDAVDAAYELKNHIEDTYQEDDDECWSSDVEDSAKQIARALELLISGEN